MMAAIWYLLQLRTPCIFSAHPNKCAKDWVVIYYIGSTVPSSVDTFSVNICTGWPLGSWALNWTMGKLTVISVWHFHIQRYVVENESWGWGFFFNSCVPKKAGWVFVRDTLIWTCSPNKGNLMPFHLQFNSL